MTWMTGTILMTKLQPTHNITQLGTCFCSQLAAHKGLELLLKVHDVDVFVYVSGHMVVIQYVFDHVWATLSTYGNLSYTIYIYFLRLDTCFDLHTYIYIYLFNMYNFTTLTHAIDIVHILSNSIHPSICHTPSAGRRPAATGGPQLVAALQALGGCHNAVRGGPRMSALVLGGERCPHLQLWVFSHL